MKVLILAGGLGTRLHSVIGDRPKGMAIISGRPFLEYQIERLSSYGFQQIVLCVGYLAHQIQEYFGNGKQWGVEITYAVESELLGTAGAIKNAEHFIDGTFLVLNGDSYLEADPRALVDFHRSRRSDDSCTLGTVAAAFMDNASIYGALGLNADARILRFREKAEIGPGWINGGVYILEPAILELIPTDKAVSIERETFPLVLARGQHLYAYRVEGFFVDIGTPEGYQRFCRYVEERGR